MIRSSSTAEAQERRRLAAIFERVGVHQPVREELTQALLRWKLGMRTSECSSRVSAPQLACRVAPRPRDVAT